MKGLLLLGVRSLVLHTPGNPPEVNGIAGHENPCGIQLFPGKGGGYLFCLHRNYFYYDSLDVSDPSDHTTAPRSPKVIPAVLSFGMIPYESLCGMDVWEWLRWERVLVRLGPAV